MRMNSKKFYVHFLVIAAIFMAGISPACAFLSAKGSIQICAPDGTLQVIEVDAAFDPFAKPMPLSEHLEAMEQCPYCFHADHKIASHDLSQFIDAPVLGDYLFISSGSALPKGQTLHGYQPRGPPQLS